MTAAGAGAEHELTAPLAEARALDRPSSCKRCSWRVVKVGPLNKCGPTGHPKRTIGMWEQLECLRCGSTNGRWAKGIDETTVADAWAAYRELTNGPDHEDDRQRQAGK